MQNSFIKTQIKAHFHPVSRSKKKPFYNADASLNTNQFAESLSIYHTSGYHVYTVAWKLI